MEGSGQSTLRAKYLDWCSARLAERFLDLSPEEIYAMARPASSERAERSEPADRPEPSGSTGDLPSAGGDPSASPSRAISDPDPAAAPARPIGGSPPLPRPTDEGYRILVQRVTESLLQRTSLPTFEQWAEAYAETPERFEAELLGFWKDAVGEDAAGDDTAGEDAARDDAAGEDVADD